MQVLGALSIFVVSDHLKELRFFAAALNGACLATLFFAQKRGKQCGNLGRGAIAGQKLAGRNCALTMCCGKDFLNLLKRCGVFPNCLVGVAQKQEVRTREVLSKHHKLCLGIVLNLVNHDKLDVFLASACDKKSQVNAFGTAQRGGVEHAHANAVDAQPGSGLDDLVRRGKTPVEELAGARQNFFLVGRADGATKDLKLLLNVKGEHLFLDFVVVSHLAKSALQAGVKLVFGKCNEARANRELRELCYRTCHLSWLDKGGSFNRNGLEVVLVELKRGKLFLKLLQRIGVVVGARRMVGQTQSFEERIPGKYLRIVLAHARQNGVDVATKHLVRSKQIYLICGKCGALLVQKVRNALQQNGRLTRARNAVDQQNRHVLVSDHNILFALDSCGDGLQLLGVLTLQSGKQQRVFDGNRCVKVEVQLVARNVKLSAKLQLNGSFLTVYLVRRSTHLLVVIRLGNGAAPVNNERRAVFVGDTRRTNVHIARRTSRSHLECDLGKVWLPQENFDSTEFLDSKIVVLVVRINNAVERLNSRKGLDGFVRSAKVWADFFTHLT